MLPATGCGQRRNRALWSERFRFAVEPMRGGGIFILAVMAWLTSSCTAIAEPDHPYSSQTAARVRVGDLLFSVPLTYDFRIDPKQEGSASQSSARPSASRQRPGQEMEAGGLGFFIHQYGEGKVIPRSFPGTIVRISLSPAGKANHNTFETLKSMGILSLKDIEEAPMEHGIKRLRKPMPKSSSHKSLFLIPASLQTPSGMPLIFDCGPKPISRQQGAPLGYSCDSYYGFGGRYTVQMSFYSGSVPPQDLHLLLAYMRQLLTSLRDEPRS